MVATSGVQKAAEAITSYVPAGNPAAPYSPNTFVSVEPDTGPIQVITAPL
jgi:hypothetical protein